MFENNKFSYHDFTIWAKLYKNDTYKKAVNFLTFERFSVFNCYNEDLIGLFIICNVAKNYKYIKKYGVYHRNFNKSASYTAEKDKRVFDDIFFSEVILNLGKKQFKKYGAIFLIKRVYLSNNKNNQYLLKVLSKIMNCEFIGKILKNKIKLKFRKLLF